MKKKKMKFDLMERIGEIAPEAMYPTDMRAAIIGIVERCGMDPQILLDRQKCIRILVKEGMTPEEAEEFFEYNTLGTGGDHVPCFATLNKDIEKGF
jgi:uncharacterized protein YutE (UPF0331/DUF86 family)